MDNSLMQVAAILGSIGMLLVAIKNLVRFTKKTIYLIDDMVGSDDDGKLGVVKRITIIESELRAGDGTSLRDQVNKIGQWAKDHTDAHERNRKETTDD